MVQILQWDARLFRESHPANSDHASDIAFTATEPASFHLHSSNQVDFLPGLSLTARPPCAIDPLPALRDIVPTGFCSPPCIDANANESVL